MTRLMTTVLLASTILTAPAFAQDSAFSVTAISQVKEANTRVTALAIDFGKDLPLNWKLQSAFSVRAELKPVKSHAGDVLGNSAAPAAPRTIVRAYTSDRPEIGSPRQGRYVIIELDSDDFNASSWYMGYNPSFRQILPYGENMVYDVDLLHDLSFFSPNISQTEASSEVDLVPETATFDLQAEVIQTADEFEQGIFEQPYNSAIRKMGYSFYRPEGAATIGKHPLVVFLHGSGQSHDTNTFGDDVAADSIAPLITNQGGVTWIENAREPSFVLVPQAPARDRRDDDNEGGWRSADARSLLNGLLDQIIAENPDIDTNRIYLTGLSLGAMGSWKLLMDSDPEISDRFAAAVLMNGIPANLTTITAEDPAERLKETEAAIRELPFETISIPLWLMHSDTDQSVNVIGSRLPFAMLTGSTLDPDGVPQGAGLEPDVTPLVENYVASNATTGEEVRYTEYNFGEGDHMLELGMVTPIAHFSWEASFKDQAMIDWLFDQRKND